jgi:hypothetical protein
MFDMLTKLHDCSDVENKGRWDQVPLALGVNLRADSKLAVVRLAFRHAGVIQPGRADVSSRT